MVTNKKIEKNIEVSFIILSIAFIICINVINIFAATPQPPDFLNVTENTTRETPSVKMVNISGGYIAVMNLTATVQNTRWKAFVGQLYPSLTLQDSSGAQIYDWTLTTTTGRIYATRNSSSPTWVNVECANLTTLNEENVLLEHANVNDNLTKTFNITAGATHGGFNIGAVSFSNDTCPTLNTYKENATQDTDFEEIALYDDSNIFFTTLLESNVEGYNHEQFDFQMIVPENGNSSRSIVTAYYIYVELD